MMNSVLNCGAGGWFMIAAGIAWYGVLLLAAVALIKHLSSGRSRPSALSAG